MTFRLLIGSLVSAFLVGGCGAPPASSEALSDSALQAIVAVESAYVAGWLSDDSSAVMATFAPGAVIIPGGMEPIRGDSAIRAFWWPRDSSETRVTDYETAVDEIGGSSEMAFARGTGSLDFDWRSGPSEGWTSFSQRSVWLALLRRTEDGGWRTTHRMWQRVEP